MSAERQYREMGSQWFRQTAQGPVPARMTTREDRHAPRTPYRFPVDEFVWAISTGCTCHECQAPRTFRPMPVGVPEAPVKVRGGIARSSVQLVKVTDAAPFADVWGDAR